MSLSKIRISDVDITEIEVPLVLFGKTHNIRIAQTCYGDFLANITHVFMLAGIEEEKPAYNHFNKISKRVDALQHCNAKLKEHFKVFFLQTTPKPHTFFELFIAQC